MSDKSKRRFWQIHLSTLLILCFATALFIWLNMPRTILNDNENIGQVAGWPYEVLVPYAGMASHHKINLVNGVLKNALTGITLLLAVINLSEYLIRRRERKT